MSSYSYENYSIDKDIVENLHTSLNEMNIDLKKMENEHSLGIPIKYLSEIYPSTSFVPIAVSPFYSDEVLNKVSEIVSSDKESKTLFVLSIDFAHNMGIDEALKNNEESIEAIRNFDFNKILTYNDEHLDSPVATVLFLKIMNNLGFNKWTTLYSTHGSVFVGEPDLNGTSYVVGVFSEM